MTFTLHAETRRGNAVDGQVTKGVSGAQETALPPPLPGGSALGGEAAALAQGWRRLGAAASFVALLTAPFFFLLLYFGVGWSALGAAIVTVFAVIAFRGLVDVLVRRVIPWPSLFGWEDGRLKERDISARRAAWFWQTFYRRLIWFVVIYGLLVVVIWLGNAILGDGISWADAATAIPDWIGNQFSDPTLRSQWVGLAISLPILFMVNVLIFLGPLLYAGIKQIQAFEPGDADWGVRLGDVRGQESPKEEVRKIVTLWQSGEAFEMAGGKRERGILFLGPPGTGKTMLAKAIATGFNCPFVAIPGSAFAQTFIGVDVVLVMFLARKARKLAAKWGGQCIVFIDEIDSVGMRRQSLQGGAAISTTNIHDVCFFGPYGAINPTGDLVLETRAWRDRMFAERAPARGSLYPAAVQRVADRVRDYAFPGGMGGGMGQGGLQQLLVTMDGVSAPKPSKRFMVNKVNTFLDASYFVPRRLKGRSLRMAPARPRREELYFIGACNVPLHTLDPALTRPGRMGRHVHFRTPTRTDRKDIFDLYLGRVSHEAELDGDRRRDELARITFGHSPAMIEQVCSLALTYAAHDGRPRFGWDDLVEAITTVEAGTATNFEYIPEESRATAIHESGHAVTGHMYMKGFTSTRLTIRPRGSSGGHHALSEVEERMFRWRSEEFASLVWGLGAMAAERLFYGENTTGVGGDVMSVTAGASLMVGRAGMAPERPDLRGRIEDPDERDAAETRIMARFERLGIQIMNRASGGSAMDADPVRAVLADPDKRRMVAQLLGQAYVTAFWFVERNRHAVERVADTLEQRRELFGDEVVGLLDSLHLEEPSVDILDESTWPRI
jgi:cell division protease FtsH